MDAVVKCTLKRTPSPPLQMPLDVADPMETHMGDELVCHLLRPTAVLVT